MSESIPLALLPHMSMEESGTLTPCSPDTPILKTELVLHFYDNRRQEELAKVGDAVERRIVYCPTNAMSKEIVTQVRP